MGTEERWGRNGCQLVSSQFDVHLQATDPLMTIAEAQMVLEAGVADGVLCPCCGQNTKVYSRKFSNNMAVALLHLYRAEDEWVHLKQYLLDHKLYCSDAPSLRWWGMVEEKPEGKDDGNPRAGFYRITDSGRAFARGEITTARWEYHFNGKSLGFSSERTTIAEALGDKFNYDELMAPTRQS